MTEREKISHIYHSLFNYSLSQDEILKWEAGKNFTLKKKHKVFKKFKNIQSDQSEKIKIAKKAAALLLNIPFVQFVGITGSLAMNNAKKESDIDLMIITTSHSLWVTRFLSISLLSLKGFALRHAKVANEQDKVCLNLWLDMESLEWKQQKNGYIAHEIAQVVPLVNKHNTYEKWIKKNEWIFGYWPRAISKPTIIDSYTYEEITLWDITKRFLNLIFFLMQYFYMQGKRTRETVTLHEAYFHPYDWGAKIITELRQKGVSENVI